MRYYILIMLSIIITSCSLKKPEETRDAMTINLRNVDLYIKLNPHADIPISPPILYLDMEVNNLTNYTKVFVTKANEKSTLRSQLLMIDTLSEKVIPIYSTGAEIIEPNKTANIRGAIDLKQIKDYLKLKDDFFENEDYTSDKYLLGKRCIEMLHNSIVIYIQNPADLAQYISFNKNITPLDSTKIIKVNMLKGRDSLVIDSYTWDSN